MLVMAGCGTFGQKDSTADWPVEKLFEVAKNANRERSHQYALDILSKLQARYPYSRESQQGDLEIAYAYYKLNEADQSVAAANRFIQRYPNSENVDYAYYLRGLAHFNDDLNLLNRLMGQDDLSTRDPTSARSSFNDLKTLSLIHI